MVRLEEITKDNYLSALSLSITEKQSAYLRDNTYSLAQAYVFRDIARPFLILDDDDPIGFILMDIDGEKENYHVWRFMIDKSFQRRGYGKQALLKAIDYMKSEGARVIKLSHETGNELPGKLYLECGFRYTGVIEDGEVLMELRV